MHKGGYVRREQDKLRPPKVSQFRSDRLTSLYVYSSRVQRERTLVRQGERRQTRSFRLTWRHRGDEYFTRPLPGDCHLSSGHPLPGSAIAPSPTTPAGLDRALSPGPSPRRWASCPGSGPPGCSLRLRSTSRRVMEDVGENARRAAVLYSFLAVTTGVLGVPELAILRRSPRQPRHPGRTAQPDAMASSGGLCHSSITQSRAREGMALRGSCSCPGLVGRVRCRGRGGAGLARPATATASDFLIAVPGVMRQPPL